MIAPQKPDGRPSPEQMNSYMTRFWRPTLPIPVLAGTRMGKPWMQQKEWMCLCDGLRETNVEMSLSIYVVVRQAKGRMSQPQKGRRHHGRGGEETDATGGEETPQKGRRGDRRHRRRANERYGKFPVNYRKLSSLGTEIPETPITFLIIFLIRSRNSCHHEQKLP